MKRENPKSILKNSFGSVGKANETMKSIADLDKEIEREMKSL